MNPNEVVKNLKSEMQAFISKGGIPCFEYKLNNGEYLIVNLEVVKKGIKFSFDSMDLKTWFSGEIIKIHDNRYLLKADQYTEDLDSYLQQIDQEILDGFIVPNDLFCE